MTPALTDHRNPDGRKPTSTWLLQNPIDFIAEDHLRLRTICAEIDRLVEAATPEPEALSTLRDYLCHELPDLLADEDEDLMPLILARAEPEDELPKLARRLDREHAQIEELRAPAAQALSGDQPVSAWSEGLRATLRQLARATRRHLILENAVLLPLARVRLTPEDLIALRKAMLRRRGLKDPFLA